MPARPMKYLAARLNPARTAFEARLTIAFATHGPDATPRDAFGLGWEELPEDQKHAVAAAWHEMQQSHAQLPQPTASRLETDGASS